MGGGEVRVVYTKYDGGVHRDYPARRLAEDDLGTWLGIPAGTPSIYHGRPLRQEHPYVVLVPRDRWWTAMFNPPPRTAEVYCDITTPARWTGPDEVHLVDLDLDVVRRRHTGLVQLLDQDDFADHLDGFGYPADLVVAARRAAGWLFGALGDGTEPFDTTYRTWLALVT
ncbi:hypothetical protein GCM10010123_21200 [Pilimelia anulata]|uniref:DUF402 domain-containing protein n=1 Tax=Pilimelia anulata TaxID=53371 RepID=A0A8J3F7U8_9ACTN|nr:DUF402 domain-containing protein [Pilimelia anulata]GGJ91072.1 hypothetical protein GCM10010123_21200 [Pilimelia anulata]